MFCVRLFVPGCRFLAAFIAPPHPKSFSRKGHIACDRILEPAFLPECGRTVRLAKVGTPPEIPANLQKTIGISSASVIFSQKLVFRPDFPIFDFCQHPISNLEKPRHENLQKSFDLPSDHAPGHALLPEKRAGNDLSPNNGSRGTHLHGDAGFTAQSACGHFGTDTARIGARTQDIVRRLSPQGRRKMDFRRKHHDSGRCLFGRRRSRNKRDGKLRENFRHGSVSRADCQINIPKCHSLTCPPERGSF